jgi:hypothetical protein
VNIRKVSIIEINITNITYRNVRVNNGVTVINRNTFVTGRQETVNVKQNVFLTEKISVGRPDIKPEKASFAPAIKVIEPAKLPPQHVNKIEVKALKQERRLEKEQSKSVINRDAPAKALVVKTLEKSKSAEEKKKDRQQSRMEKGKTQEPAAATESKADSQAERKAAKGPEEKTAGPAIVPETKETKQTKDGRQLGREEKPKPAAAVEANLKVEEKSGKAALPESKGSRGVELKTETQVERKTAKGPEEKIAGPAILPEAKETKQTKDRRQLVKIKPGSKPWPWKREKPPSRNKKKRRRPRGKRRGRRERTARSVRENCHKGLVEGRRLVESSNPVL